MLIFLDQNDREYSALATISVTNGVNGQRSISGDIVSNELVLNRIDKGWRLRFENEYYVITYAKPIDKGNKVQVSFDAVHQFFWDFSKSSKHEQLKDGSHRFEEYLQFIFSGSGYSYVSEVKVKAFEKQSFGYKNRLALFNDIISASGVEFSVKGKVVRILEKVGTDLSTVVRKHFNMNELTIEKKIGNFFTYQKGFGKWFDENDHSKGRLEVEYQSALAKEYGVIEGDPVVDERYTQKDSLLEVLKKNVESSYSVSVQLTMEDLTRAGYQAKRPVAGDYIMAINETIQFREKIRIVSFTSQYDVRGRLIDHKVTCNDIGSVKRQSSAYVALSSAVANAQHSSINALSVANKALVSADGQNRVYFDTTMPKDIPKGTLIRGDKLYLTVGDVVKSYYWNGLEWLLEPVANDVESLKNNINQQLADFDTNYKSRQASQDTQIRESLKKIGIAENVAEEAKAISQRLKEEATKESARLINEAKSGLEETILQRATQSMRELQETNQRLEEQKTNLANLTNRTIGVETRLSNISNQFGQQTTRIEQLINDGQAKGQKLNEVLSSVDGMTVKLKNLWSGSRNLLSNTETLTGLQGVLPYPKNHYLNKAVFRWTFPKGSTQYQEGLNLPVNDTLVNPKEMILSFYANASETTTVRCYMYNPNGKKDVETSSGFIATDVADGYSEVVITPGWNRYWVRYTYKVGYVAKPEVIIGRSMDRNMTGQNITVSIVAPALYHGHYNRDWQPSDLDISSQFAMYVQNNEQNYAQIGNELRKLNGDVTRVQTEFNQTKEGLTLLATKSELQQGIRDLTAKDDQQGQLLSEHTAKLSVLNNEISAKVSKTEHNTLTGRVTSAETTIRQQADEISKRLTSSQVDSVVNGKLGNYATLTVLNNKIKETSDSFSRELTETKQSIEDSNNAIQIKFNTLESSVDKHTQTIGNIQGEVSRVVQTAQVIQSSVNNMGQGMATMSNLVRQTANSWSVQNLNSKEEIVSQINATGNNVLIAGNKVRITGQTLIDDGVIKNAAIGSLDAGKVNFGTLNGANVNVINLNANNIVSGSLSANRISGGELRSLDNGLNFDLNKGQIWLSQDWNIIRQDGNGTRFLQMNRGGDIQLVSSPRTLTSEVGEVGGYGLRISSQSYSSIAVKDGFIIGFDNDRQVQFSKYGDVFLSSAKIHDVRDIVWKNGDRTISLKDFFNIINSYLSANGGSYYSSGF